MASRQKQRAKKKPSKPSKEVQQVTRALEAYKGGHSEITVALEVMRLAQTSQIVRSPADIRGLSYRYTLA